MRKEKRIIGPLAKLWGSNLTDGSLTDPPPTTPFLPSRHACAKVLLENKQSQEASAAHSPAGRYTAPLSTARIMSRTDSIREEPRPARWPRLGEWTAASGARGGGHPHRDGVWKPCGADGGSDRHSDPPPSCHQTARLGRQILGNTGTTAFHRVSVKSARAGKSWPVSLMAMPQSRGRAATAKCSLNVGQQPVLRWGLTRREQRWATAQFSGRNCHAYSHRCSRCTHSALSVVHVRLPIKGSQKKEGKPG